MSSTAATWYTQRLEAAQDIAVARDEAAAAPLDVAQRSKPIVFELKEPFGVVERLLPPGRDDRLDAGKCHLADTARPADFVQFPHAGRCWHLGTRRVKSQQLTVPDGPGAKNLWLVNERF